MRARAVTSMAFRDGSARSTSTCVARFEPQQDFFQNPGDASVAMGLYLEDLKKAGKLTTLCAQDFPISP